MEVTEWTFVNVHTINKYRQSFMHKYVYKHICKRKYVYICAHVCMYMYGYVYINIVDANP
jgi:hypothetical protein